VLAGLDNIDAIVTLDSDTHAAAANPDTPRRERPDLDRVRQTIPDADARGSDAARGALFSSVRRSGLDERACLRTTSLSPSEKEFGTVPRNSRRTGRNFFLIAFDEPEPKLARCF
jgi:hypothetical protein